MKNSDPLVSVIMPVYNGELYIAEAIKSLLDQTYPNWELLIVNDGSTDNSKTLIQTFNDPRIFYFEQTNKGVSAARNLALMRAKGKYFCFLDADDCFTPSSIEDRLKVFAESEKIKFVDGTVQIFDKALTTILRTRIATYKGKPFSELLHINPGIFFGPTWMIKRSKGVVYQFNEQMKYLEDLYFYFQISDQGDFSYTEKVILKYRSHNQSAMRNLDGIARGYTQLANLVLNEYAVQLTFWQRLIWRLRIRKIMLLSYWGEGQLKKGCWYFIFGK
ncbi:MAG: glycosyltransferase [Flammeovirgaceae bacterium]|nr:glycosyltransferase [Flammeovirgaceae bacterium]